jgi:hypothetical protein
MQTVGLVLLVFAFVCAVLATLWQPPAGPFARWNLLAAAIAFWIAAELFGGLTHTLH